jgi:sugar O-acyltransferase (sialic acid O-acetyltransferase NeuD family)
MITRAKILIFGAGGLGREIMQIIRDLQQALEPIDCVGFAVDRGYSAPSLINALPVRSDWVEWLRSDPELQIVVAIGDPAARAAAVQRITAVHSARFATLVHPRAWTGKSVVIGEGSVVFGNSSATTDVRIGRHVLINPGCTIAHDCVLEDFATLAPSVALTGGVVVGSHAELGVGARVAPRLRIGTRAVVGAGAVVIRDIGAGTTVVGVPAKPLRRT